MTNLALWNAVEKTDPKQTKAITGKPYKGTSPKPYYLVQKATETFGPCGIGWGFQIVSERVEDGAAGDKVHIAHIRLWYVWDDKRGEVDHVGQTMFSGKNKNGPYTDEDAPKKSVTDALVKALSMVGFAGDIFMGRYDDSKYVQELHDEARQETHSAPQQGRNAAAAPSNMRNASRAAAAPNSGNDGALSKASLFAAKKCADVEQLRSWWGEQLPQIKRNMSPDGFDKLKGDIAAIAEGMASPFQEAAE